MDDFVLFDLNDSQNLCDRFNNNILDIAGFCFDIHSTHILQQQPSYDRLISTGDNFVSIHHENDPISQSQTSSISHKTQASRMAPTERAETFKQYLKLVKVDLGYNLRRWLEQCAEKDHWAGLHRRT